MLMNKIVFLLVAVIMLFFVGCSNKIPSSPYAYIERKSILSNKKESLLAKRFIEYWDARIKGDIQKAWQYELPYMHYLDTYKHYKAVATGYYGKKVILVKIEPQSDKEVIITRKVFIEPKKYIIKKDKWFYVKDNWYHKFYQAILPPQSEEEAEFQ